MRPALRLTLAALVVASVPLAPGAAAAEKIRLVAWSPSNLPNRTEAALDQIDGVRASTVVFGLGWVTATRDSDGAQVERAPSGYAWPIEIAFIEPVEYARFAPPAHRALIRSLDGRRAVIPHAEEELRNGATRWSIGESSVRVTGVVGNRASHGFEALMARPAPAFVTQTLRFVLIEKEPRITKERLRRTIERVVGDSDYPLRIKSEEQTRFLRYGDMVRPQLLIKKHFGEFAARRADGNRLQLDPGWTGGHIRRESVPILGGVTCHRKLFPQLRHALQELQDKGLAHLVDGYAGCYNARFVATAPGVRISRHTWGIAADINPSGNCFGCSPNQDPRLVRVFEKWGFTWGGRWAIPDGMHFEWYRWPRI